MLRAKVTRDAPQLLWRSGDEAVAFFRCDQTLRSLLQVSRHRIRQIALVVPGWRLKAPGHHVCREEGNRIECDFVSGPPGIDERVGILPLNRAAGGDWEIRTKLSAADLFDACPRPGEGAH